MRHARLLLGATIVVGAILSAACTVGLAEQSTEDLTVSVVSETAVRVGERPFTVRIEPRGSEVTGDLKVLFHYFPFVHRVKDFLASPDEVVRVVPAARGPEGYAATLELDRPGPWKVAVRIIRADKADTIVYFTLEAEESPGTGDD
ncbi:MAG: hypothetical protein HYY76_12220 [Acidobacteria bacterium]|nr:hypothetical protein [Acidobacteriota bacterium]